MYIFLKPIISDFPTVLFPFPLLRFNENECFSHRKPTALCRWACSDHAWNFFSLDRKKRLKSKRPMCKGQPRKGPERPPRDWRTGQGRAVPGQGGAGCGGGKRRARPRCRGAGDRQVRAGQRQRRAWVPRPFAGARRQARWIPSRSSGDWPRARRKAASPFF